MRIHDTETQAIRFCATEGQQLLDIGDIGTKGGLKTDANANVLRSDGSAIGGLYAVGNVSASITYDAYPGAGGTLGPAMTFGLIAAEHIAGQNADLSTEQPITAVHANDKTQQIRMGR